jgi:hypothetical protein
MSVTKYGLMNPWSRLEPHPLGDLDPSLIVRPPLTVVTPLPMACAMRLPTWTYLFAEMVATWAIPAVVIVLVLADR